MIIYDENFRIHVAKINCPTDVKVAICEIEPQPLFFLLLHAQRNDCSTCLDALAPCHLYCNTKREIIYYYTRQLL